MRAVLIAAVMLVGCEPAQPAAAARVPAWPVEMMRTAYTMGAAVEDPCRVASVDCGLCAEARPLLREIVDRLRDDVVERWVALQRARLEAQWRQRGLWPAVATAVETVEVADRLARLPQARALTDGALAEARACLVRLADPAFALADRAAYIGALRAGCGGVGVR